MISLLAGIGIGVAAYLVVTAAEAVLRTVRARTRPTSSARTGLGCETEFRPSAEPPVQARCWCGGSLEDATRIARIYDQPRAWCAECNRWSPVKEPS